MTSRRAQAQTSNLQPSANRRQPRACVGLALLGCAFAGACEVRESAFERNDPVSLTRGRAVAQWDAALRLEPDAAMDAALTDLTRDAAESAADSGKRGSDDQRDEDASSPSTTDAAMPAIDAGPSAPLVFRVTTVSQAGRFAPKNVGAIWIQDSNSHFVKTLAVWAGVSTRYLTRYCAANKSGNKVDAITSATLPDHVAHQVTWDLTDGNRQPVSDGDYQLLVESTDHNGPGQLLTVPFTKGNEPRTLSPADTAYFQKIELRFAGN
jgi:hypothetical protein